MRVRPCALAISAMRRNSLILADLGDAGLGVRHARYEPAELHCGAGILPRRDRHPMRTVAQAPQGFPILRRENRLSSHSVSRSASSASTSTAHCSDQSQLTSTVKEMPRSMAPRPARISGMVISCS